jgi:hypothetical protein
MTLYRVSGFVFASAMRFPELTPAAGARASCRLVISRGRLAPARPQWYHRWRLPGGVEWVRFARVGPDYLLRFPGVADFLVSGDGAVVRCRPRASAPRETLRHLFLHQVLPFVLGQRGGLVVHASAVATPAGAIAFLGGSRRGKSTLAASFWIAGCPLITDDCLRLDERRGRLFAVPGYPSLRLWPDAVQRLAIHTRPAHRPENGTGKVRVTSGAGARRFAGRALPIARVYVLARVRSGRGRQPIRIEPLSARDGLVEIIAHLYRLDVGRRDLLRRDFDRLARIAQGLAVRRLHVPRGLARLGEVREVVMRDLMGIENWELRIEN